MFRTLWTEARRDHVRRQHANHRRAPQIGLRQQTTFEIALDKRGGIATRELLPGSLSLSRTHILPGTLLAWREVLRRNAEHFLEFPAKVRVGRVIQLRCGGLA